MEDNLRDTYPFNTFHGTTKEELITATRAAANKARIDELKSLPPYIHDAFPSIKDRIREIENSDTNGGEDE